VRHPINVANLEKYIRESVPGVKPPLELAQVHTAVELGMKFC
jgi:hypothetical protein